MTKIKDKTILITGGASGIGKLMAEKSFFEEAKRVILWDINEALLEETTLSLRDQGYDTYAYQVDVSNLANIKEMAKDVLQEIGDVDILINNAGIVVGKDFVDHSHKEIDSTLDINVAGVMHITLEFLPTMIKKGNGHIVNIASASSLVANPKMSVYAASKWAVMGWSESLRLEMKQTKKDIHVTTVLPGYIDTGMFEGVKAPMLTPLLQPDEIVDEIIAAISKNEILVHAPKIVNYIPLLRGVLPTKAWDYLAEKMGVYHSMDKFTGRK